MGAMPGRIRPTLFFARSSKKFAASLSKWLGSIQPKIDVPPIEVITMRFLISQFLIFHGVNRLSYFESITCLLAHNNLIVTKLYYNNKRQKSTAAIKF